MLRSSIFYTTATFLCLCSSALFAKSIDMHAKPEAKSKVVGKINTLEGVVPIFTQKNGNWIKVGDPSNGNTGWVKSADLAGSGGTPNNFSFSQSYMSHGNGLPSTVIRFGDSKHVSEKVLNKIFKSNWQQQQEMQREVQKMMNDFFSTNSDWISYPMILPVMVVPVEKNKLIDHSEIKKK